MFLVKKSKNRKIGNIASTYLPIAQTCPITCPLRNAGCYAKASFVAIHNSRLQKACSNKSAYDLIRKEAREIISNGASARGKSLRLHVSGDVRTNKMAGLLANAEKHWDGKVYTYTHSWRNISRKSWKNISVLASVENIEDAAKALRKGYAPAMIVEKHPENKRAFIKNGLKLIPCPQQTMEITCEKCKLCMNDKFLKATKSVITFAAHGAAKKRALTVIR